MAAYSVTGRGRGLSNGELKPNNHCGCDGCFSSDQEIIVEKKNKRSCSINFKYNQSINTEKISSSNTIINVCE